MALIIENGSLVVGATSFVSVAEVRAYAAARASTVPAMGGPGDAQIEAACIVAIDFLESLRDKYQGSKVDASTQALQWPRTGAYLDGAEILQTAIPRILKDAQCQLALEVCNGVDLMPSGDGREVIRKKIDVLETEWKPGTGSNPQPALTRVRALLAPLLRYGTGQLTVIRA